MPTYIYLYQGGKRGSPIALIIILLNLIEESYR